MYHYNDVIMGAIASQITSLTIVYSTVYSENASIWWRHHANTNSLNPEMERSSFWLPCLSLETLQASFQVTNDDHGSKRDDLLSFFSAQWKTWHAISRGTKHMMTSSNGNIFRVTGPKGQCREALMFSLICAWINGWVNTREAGDLRRHRTNYDVIVMQIEKILNVSQIGEN